MDPKPRHIVPSGIEPVDSLIGGLEAGKLYLVHGEGSSKSLFGIKFLIEGLKRGEHVALVINYSPEDAVRKFARVGQIAAQAKDGYRPHADRVGRLRGPRR